MKHQLKNYLKLGILLFGISIILVNCEKDEMSISNEQTIDFSTKKLPKVNYYTNKSLPKVVSEELEKSLKSLESKNSTRDLQISFGTILTDRIMQTISEDSIENFTFRVELDDDDPKTFYNFIIRQNADSTFSEPYIKKYTMSDSFYDNYSNGIATFDSFEGEFTNYSITESIDIDNLLNRSGDCPPVPVDDDTTNDPNDPVNNSGGGGGGSATGTTGNTNSTTQSNGIPVTCSSSIVVIPCNGSTAYGGGNHDGSNPACTGTFKGATYLRIVCSDGSGGDIQLKSAANKTSSNPCPGDDGDVGVLDEDDVLISKCKKLKKLSESSSFQQRMQELINNTSGNTEINYWGRNDNLNNMNYADSDRSESAENAREIKPNPPISSVDSYIHNHSFVTVINQSGQPVTYKPFPVFSGADLYTVSNMYVNGLINDLSDFIIVVATPGQNINSTDDDTVYAITITNTQQFINLANALAVTPLLIDNFYNDPNNLISTSISTSVNEERLARLFKDKKMGMQLFRGDKDDLNNWTQIKVKNNGEIQKKNCN